MTLYHPKRGEVYTVKQIVTELKLRDSPFLCSEITNPLGEKVEVVIQTAWCTEEQLIPIMGDDRYRYIRETDEWIPVFHFTGTEEEFLKSVECGVTLDPYLKEDDPVGMTVWPKGTEYSQYYTVNEDHTVLTCRLHTYQVSPELKRALDIEKSKKA